MSTVLLVSVVALLLDRGFGEPRRWHPLVGFGILANSLERHLNSGPRRRARGVLAWLLLLVPALAVAVCAQVISKRCSPALFDAVAAIVVYAAIGRQSLSEHARAVALALRAADLPAARRAVAKIVSRDTSELDAVGVSRATVETVLENGSDAVIASLFWFALAGVPGVVLHRLANTLDAMWGYRTERFNEFGWAAARIDDVLNYIPARLTALGYALCGRLGSALRCWRAQAALWSSPNAGPVMAAGAGALQLMLGGGAWYHGSWEERPTLGCARAPQVQDIDRALALLDRATGLWLLILLVGAAWLWGANPL